jgi:hypothetical protein
MVKKCKFCGKEFQNPMSIGGHVAWCKKNPDGKKPFINLSKEKRIEINKKINSDPKISEKRNKTFKDNKEKGLHQNYTGKSKDPNINKITSEKLSKIAKDRNLGGYVKGSGRGKNGWYKGFWCDSSWELAWVIYNLDHGINFKRNSTGFEYSYEGNIRKYYPDFIIDGFYYEIKGRKNFDSLDEREKQKIKQFKQKLIVLYRDEMKPYLEFVISKYGKDYIRLYEE